jgi:hypothetical protein
MGGATSQEPMPFVDCPTIQHKQTNVSPLRRPRYTKVPGKDAESFSSQARAPKIRRLTLETGMVVLTSVDCR